MHEPGTTTHAAGTTSGTGVRPARDLRSPQVLDLEAEASTLFDEPEWAEGDRNSRTIATSDRMRVTLTALRAGAELGSAGNDDSIAVQVLRGTVHVQLNGVAGTLTAGQLATMADPGPWRLRADADALLLVDRRERRRRGGCALTALEPAPSTFDGVAFCHVPADEPIRLDALIGVDGEEDRWNRPGEPTVYLATDPVTAIAELARHLDLGPGDPPVRRRLLGLSLRLDGLLDLRRPDARRALGAPDGVEAFRDREIARGAAGAARIRDDVGGILVPSMAFLDDLSRANLVLFMERLGGDLDRIVRAQHEAGIVEIRPGAMRL